MPKLRLPFDFVYTESTEVLRTRLGLDYDGQNDIITPMTISHIQKNKGLTQAFKRYQKRYLAAGKKPNVKKLLPEILYRTMKLEGEKISRKEANALFR